MPKTTSMTGNDQFDAQNISLEYDGRRHLVRDIIQDSPDGKERLVSYIDDIIAELNGGTRFEIEIAREWVHYLLMLMDGKGRNLANPYSDLENYSIDALSDNTNTDSLQTVIALKDLPKGHLSATGPNALQLMQKTLFITAIGGTDSTFYEGLTASEMINFINDFYPADLVECFKKADAINIIPRAFAPKKDDSGNLVTNVENTLLQAYHLGIRNALIIANARTRRAISDYIKQRLGAIKDFNIMVAAQPLLPIIRGDLSTGELLISVKNAGYQGGHGHGLKNCILTKNVQETIKTAKLQFFLFGNGDNSVMLNWGAEHYAAVMQTMTSLKENPDFDNLRIGLFCVWEYLRKGGFTFLLTNKKNGVQIPQVFEAELARRSGADIKSLEQNRGGYNTNVVVGLIDACQKHLSHFPMALKAKKKPGQVNYLFEASTGTAMTTIHKDDGSSIFDINSAIGVLGPRAAKFQHWNHISTRKRDDLLAYLSSLFKVDKLKTNYGDYSLIYTKRGAEKRYPVLQGNFADPDVTNSKEFFDIFKDTTLDLDDFYGTLKIDLLGRDGKIRGKIKFIGNIKLVGEGLVTATVPAGESWIVRTQTIDSSGDCCIQNQKPVSNIETKVKMH